MLIHKKEEKMTTKNRTPEENRDRELRRTLGSAMASIRILDVRFMKLLKEELEIMIAEKEKKY
jgi:hypothetical protein